MSSNPNIALTAQQQELITELITSGRYDDASQVMSAGLRLLQDQEEERKQALDELAKAIQAGLDSGPPVPYEGADAFLQKLKASRDERDGG